MKKRNPTMWVGRGTGSYDHYVTVNSSKSPFAEYFDGGGEWYGKGYLKSFCYRYFSRYTGLKLNPGECKRIRINVEVIKC